MRPTFNRLIALAMLTLTVSAPPMSAYVSRVWSPDNGDGTFTNPVINADYSDPDVIAVGDDYYLIASSFTNTPGLPILHSTDLVNWEIVNHAVSRLLPADHYSSTHHGGGVWAPSMRYHDGVYYIYWGDPDFGVFMVKTTDPFGRWDDPVLVSEAKGVIDTCPLWDDDGRAYLVNGWAKSRAGLNAVLTVTEMSADGTRLIGEPVMVYDGIPDGNHTIEGPKFYKRGDFYYILAPAGSVTTGWQVALRSKNVYGPYEMKVVMAQGDSDINGPHQGAWVTTVQGEDWFLHFQDKGVIGRVVHLNPLRWEDDWPVIGDDPDGDGCGTPMKQCRKPKTKAKVPVSNPAESDDFNAPTLSRQWQWSANYNLPFGFPTPYGYYRLYGSNMSADFVNMWETPNILTQKFPNESFTATAKVTVSATAEGQQAGLIVMGCSYCRLGAEWTPEGFVMKLIECDKADKGKPETVKATCPLPRERSYGEGGRKVNSIDFWLRVKVTPTPVKTKEGLNTSDEICRFYYSTDGRKYFAIGEPFHAREGKWIGARVGFFAIQPDGVNRGWIDLDSFTVDP